jgi:hypothetical protein
MYIIFVAGFMQRHKSQRNPPAVREECPNLKRIYISLKFPILVCALKVVVLYVSLLIATPVHASSYQHMCVLLL